MATRIFDVPIGGDWGVRDSALRLNLLAIHLPEIDLAAALLTSIGSRFFLPPRKNVLYLFYNV
jgi:hypothetical protein